MLWKRVIVSDSSKLWRLTMPLFCLTRKETYIQLHEGIIFDSKLSSKEKFYEVITIN